MLYYHISSQLPIGKIIKIMDIYNAVAVKNFAEQEIHLAEYLAKKSYKSKKNIAKKFKYEFLLWLTGKRDIKSAIEYANPDKEGFLLIVFSENIVQIMRKLKARKHTMTIAKKANPLNLEKIALSRIW